MGRVLNMLYYDPAGGKWGRSKPIVPVMPKLTTLSVAVVQFSPNETLSDDAAAIRAKHVGDALKAKGVSIIALNGVPDNLLKAILSLDWIRGEFGATESGAAFACTILWHAGLPVQMAEGNDKPHYTAISLRRFFGTDCVVIAATFDGSASTETRAAEVHQTLSKAAATEGASTLALFNPYEGAPPSGGVLREVLAGFRERTQYLEDLSTPASGPTVWLKGPGTLILSGVVPVVAPDAFLGCIVATLLPTNAPRSSASTNENNSPTPASEVASNEVAAVFPSSPLGINADNANKKRVWSSKHSSAIRVREGTDEMHYDLSQYFTKSEDAIKALCAGSFPWPCDYVILHGRLLAVHGQNADIPSFRQYMNQHPSPPKPNFSGVSGAIQLAPPPPKVETEKRRARDSSNFSPYCLTAPTPSAHRRRHWSTGRATLLFQVTPREMRFDITGLVGGGSGTLQLAVARLNGQHTTPKSSPQDDGGNADGDGPAEDLLHIYRFDYALLYSSERHGYWLIAAADVPCDIAACRMAAKLLPGPVVALMQSS